jgi:SNF2 family DNA or RNA helicase
MLCRDNLHDYQRRGVEYILNKKRSLLALDLGLGKTITSLTAVADLIDACAVSQVLIIAPLRVANSVWHKEAANWSHTKHLRVSVCTGGEATRRKRLLDDADVYVINRENVQWLVTNYGKKWPFDCVVIDESSSFKSASSQRFKALKRILPKTDYCWLLTGTPTSNGLLDLWAQMYLVDFGERLGRTMTAYKTRFFKSDYMGYKLDVLPGASDVIHSLVSDKMMSMAASDYLTMPDRFDVVQQVQLPPSAKSAYSALERDLLLELDGDTIEAISAAALANKLLQAANGALYKDEHGNFTELHTAKLDALQELIDDNPSENLLIAYNYKSDLERLLKRFPDAVVLDKQNSTIERWNAGEIKMLLAHPASAGHGLNLQNGGSVIVWFGLNWSLELYQQFNGRLYRQGQTKPVRIIHLAAEGTIDEKVLKMLDAKDKTQYTLLDAVREIKLK